MTDDLVKRLRARRDRSVVLTSYPPQFPPDRLCQEAADCIEQLISDNKKLRNGGGARLVRSVRTLLLEKEMFDVQGGPSQDAWQELNAAYAALGEKKDA